jgi:hypothetical protein
MMPWRSASSQFDGIVLKALPSPSSHENSPEGYFRGNVEMIALLVRVLGADQLYLEEDLWYGTTTPVPRDQWLAIEVWRSPRWVALPSGGRKVSTEAPGPKSDNNVESEQKSLTLRTRLMYPA